MMDHGDQVVLIVDGVEIVLRATEAILRRKGYSPIAASGPLEALEKSRGFEGAIHLLLTDVAMPDLDGLALAQQILAERPQTRVLLMSGYANLRFRLPLLKKPFRMNHLLDQVSKVIDGPPALPSDVLADRESGRPVVSGSGGRRSARSRAAGFSGVSKRRGKPGGAHRSRGRNQTGTVTKHVSAMRLVKTDEQSDSA
jgi:CheY-like chemotaxis protein